MAGLHQVPANPVGQNLRHQSSEEHPAPAAPACISRSQRVVSPEVAGVRWWQDTSVRQYFLLSEGGCHAQDRGYIGGMNEKKVEVISAELVQKSGHSISASCPT